MFNSVKAKIISVTLSIFVVFNLLLLGLLISSYYKYKELKIENYDKTIATFEDFIDNNIKEMEYSARNLALYGSGVYYYKQSNDYLNFIVKDSFANNPDVAFGGGIFFEPYIFKNKKRFCTYALWTDDGVKSDLNCNSEEYDYFNKNWYKEPKKNYLKEDRNKVFWSAPYYDLIGNHDLMVTASAPIYDKKYNFIGISGADWLLKTILNKLDDLAPSEDSLVIFADKKHDFIIGTNDGFGLKSKLIGQSLKKIKWYNEEIYDGKNIKIKNKLYRVYMNQFENGMMLIVNVPVDNIYGAQRRMIFYGIIAEVILTILFAFIIYNVLRRNVNKPIDILIEATKKISKGDFNTTIEIKKPKEFRLLAHAFNKSTQDTKKYLENIKNLTFEKQQIEKDLKIAHEIQKSSLPNVFPPFPDITSIDIFAHMTPAKEVGGDFYDFYFIDYSHVVFSIADVSGKGVPAALFMMRAKSVLKSTSLSVNNVEDIMFKVNNSICANNEKNFFVTVALGIIDIKSGEVTYINAGHNPPVLKTKNGTKYLDIPKNLVLGVMPDINFEVIKFKLNPLDSLLLYTDGVTEATNSKFELYGEEKLLNLVSTQTNDPKAIIKNLSEDLKKHANNFEQSDDITMLCLTYLGTQNMLKKIKVPAEISEFNSFIAWLENNCKECNIMQDYVSKILIAAEEIFVNIAYYAYPNELKEKIQDTSISFKYIKPLKEVDLVFVDSGVPYNPLENKDPNINLSLEERTPGGMGIYMVKNLMTSVKYEYKNKQNILKLKLIVEENEK